MNAFIGLILCIISYSGKGDQDKLIQIEDFPSEFISTRNISILLPKSHNVANQPYPVIYMHDGQMLFDSTTTWNGQEWGVDEVVDQLVDQGGIEEVIIVGIDNAGLARHSEYFPQKPFESLPLNVQDSLYSLQKSEGTPLFSGEVYADEYLKFIVEELKPYIDQNYNTRSDRASTFIMGSSMGGLMSMYAICEYPDVFGGAACLSTHWPGVFSAENNPIPEAFFAYMENNLPDPAAHKLYFDYGTETLDAMYAPYQPQADAIIGRRGYTSENFLSRKFPGHRHMERDWNKRLHIPLTFLMNK